MHACGINAGDAAFIAGFFPPGSIPVSQYDIAGVSGVGYAGSLVNFPTVPDTCSMIALACSSFGLFCCNTSTPSFFSLY